MFLFPVFVKFWSFHCTVLDNAKVNVAIWRLQIKKQAIFSHLWKKNTWIWLKIYKKHMLTIFLPFDLKTLNLIV